MSKIYKIGVFGSAAGNLSLGKKQAAMLGEILAKNKCLIITGACSGLPYIAAHEAVKNRATVWGFSPQYDMKEQKALTPGDDNSIYSKLIYTPRKFLFKNIDVRRKYRNVISTATCDAGIIIAGRWGSMHEVASLHDFGKIIGVLTGTGGIADELKNLNKKINKPTGAKFIFSHDPKKLVNLVIKELKKRSI